MGMNRKYKYKNENEIEMLMDFVSDYVQNEPAITIDSFGKLETIFNFLLKLVRPSRCYIYEIDHPDIIKIFELCSERIHRQIYSIERGKLSIIQDYIKDMERAQTVIIKDVEKIRESSPDLYDLCKAQNVRSLAYYPLIVEDKLIGFMGFDDARMDRIERAKELMENVASAIGLYIREQNSVYNNLTSLACENPAEVECLKLNLSSHNLIMEAIKDAKTLGLIYLSLGQDNGKKDHKLLMREVYTLIHKCFSNDIIYHIGEQDYIVLCKNMEEETFYEIFERFKKTTYHINLACVAAWEDGNIDFGALFTSIKNNLQVSRAREIPLLENIKEAYTIKRGSQGFNKYIKNNYFDPEVLISSISNPNSHNYIFFGDMETNIYYISDNLVRKFGFEDNIVKDFLKEWESRIYSEKELELYRNDVEEIKTKKKNLHDLRYRVKDVRGERQWVHCQGEMHWNQENTKQLFFSGCFSCQEDEYLIDPVTTFPKESFAVKNLSQQYDEYSIIRVIGFSLNNFNEINELWGKAKGDKLLSDISRALLEEYSGKLNFYRLDGLRFAAVLAPHLLADESVLINDIRQIVLNHYQMQDVTVQSPCSFSYMTAHATEMTIQEIISNTILLINIAKTSMEDNFIAYSAESVQEKKHYAEMVIEITKNIQNNFENFRLVIQPTYSMEQHTIKGGEALLRWKFKGNNISPAEFIPILEKTKLINTVGRWVLKNVVAITKELLEKNKDIQLSFNVSYIQIYDESFFDYLAEVLEEYGVDASRLVLELTETNYNENPQKLADFFNTCIGYGLNVALDDFGSGYSSIGLLLKYPTTIVKLDRSLLNEISHSDVNQKFIKSIINSCHMFGKEVCAEGVETKLELDMMKEADCDIIQGFYFSKPLELADFFHLIEEGKK